MANKTLQRMCEERYDDEEVRQWVAEQVIKNNVEKHILSGELVLPSPQDARNHLDQLAGVYGKPAEQRELERRIAQLEQQLQDLSQPQGK